MARASAVHRTPVHRTRDLICAFAKKPRPTALAYSVAAEWLPPPTCCKTETRTHDEQTLLSLIRVCQPSDGWLLGTIRACKQA